MESMRCEQEIFSNPNRDERRQSRIVEGREQRGAARLTIEPDHDRLLPERIDNAARPAVLEEKNSGRGAKPFRI